MNQTTGSQAKKGSRLRNDLTAGSQPQEHDHPSGRAAMTSSPQQAREVKPDLRQALRPRRVGEPKRLASERQPAVNPRSTSPLRLSPYLTVNRSTVSTNVSTQPYLEEA